MKIKGNFNKNIRVCVCTNIPENIHVLKHSNGLASLIAQYKWSWVYKQKREDSACKLKQNTEAFILIIKNTNVGKFSNINKI